MIKIPPFDDSQQKDIRRASENQSTSTSELDAYRQGVELTQTKHYAQGMVKIHSGFNGQSGLHDVPQHTLGLGRARPRDENSFLEGVKLNPLDRFEPTNFVLRDFIVFLGADLAHLWLSYNGGIFSDQVGGWHMNSTFGGAGSAPPSALINDYPYPVFDGGIATKGLTRVGNFTTLDGLASWTIFAIFKTNAGQSYGAIVDKSQAFYVELSFGAGSPYITIGSGGGADIPCTIPVDDDEWHRLIVTCNAGTVTVYIDGVLDGTDTGGTIPTVSNDLLIGVQPSLTVTDSGIAVVGIMTSGLDATEVGALDDFMGSWLG